jgi:MoxR-like ATPase
MSVTASSNSTKGEKSSSYGFASVVDVQESFRKLDYISDKTLATTLFLATKLEKPLFLEGEAGVGKTELAKVLASAMDTELIRLQCYEGLDASSALYEWNYAKQLLHIKMEEGRDSDAKSIEKDIFSEQYLIERPLLRALLRSKEKPVVLLIDEIDRSDEEFEAFLLEILSDFQITIPEMGTIKAVSKPLVCSPVTGRVKFTTPLNDAAFTCGSTTPLLRKKWRLLRPRCPGLPIAWRSKSPAL